MCGPYVGIRGGRKGPRLSALGDGRLDSLERWPPEKRLADLIRASLGYDIPPGDIKALISVHRERVSRLYHLIVAKEDYR